MRVTTSGIDYLMLSADNLTHYYIDEQMDYSSVISFEIDNVLNYKINSFYRPPSTVSIYLSELILPNFLISILTPQSLINANQANFHIRNFMDVTNNNVDVNLVQTDEFTDLPDDIVSTITTSTLSSTLSSTSSLSSRRLAEATVNSNTVSATIDNSTNSYITPIIKTYNSTLYGTLLTLGRPSLSQRTLKATYYNYLLPDDQDSLCITVTITVKNNVLYNATNCATFVTANPRTFQLSFFKTDFLVETVRGNISLELTPAFNMNGTINFLVIAFDGDSITIPDEVTIWINNNQVYNEIYDKIIIVFLPNLPQQQPFTFDISEINAPMSNMNQTGIIALGSIFDDFTATMSQQTFSMEQTQALSKLNAGVFIIDISPSSFNTYQQISNMNITVLTWNYQPTINDTFRVILPDDFPPNYLITSNLNCGMCLYDSVQNFISNFQVSCIMKGTFVDITINGILQNIAVSYAFFFEISVFGIFTSPNYGVSGDFRIVVYSYNKTVLGVSYRVVDINSNPIISQNLEIIQKNPDLTQNSDMTSMGIRKGSIKPIIIRPNLNKVIILKM